MTQSDVLPQASAPGALYRAFWRWHFYAGLLVMPVLMMMALTGGLYLFKDEISGVIYRPLLTVQASAATTAPQAWADAAVRAVPGRVVQLEPTADPTRSARVVVQVADGSRRAVYVDPHDARVLGSTPDGGVMNLIKRIHSLDIAGPVFNILIEIVAGWAIVMVATGVVLWWPRGQDGGVVSIRGQPGRRVFWRDLHAVTGLFTGAIIVFLAVTGMPWSAVWGKEVRKLTTDAGWGRPAAPAAGGPHAAHEAKAAVPWALQDADIHASHGMAGMDMPGMDMPGMDMGAMDMGGTTMAAVGLNDAVARVDAAGLPRPYVLSIPAKASETWSAAYMPDKVERTRTVYLDGTSGVIADIGYGDFGPAAKTIEWGISTHQGQQFGLVNQLVMLAGCVAIWLLGISGLVMWWKRRPKGRLAAPPKPLQRSAYVGLAAVVLPLAVIYPLVGASLIVVLVGDLLVRRLWPRTAALESSR